MPLYPTFEDLRVDQLLGEQKEAVANMYKSMSNYLGLDLSSFHYNDFGELVPGPEPTPAPSLAPPAPEQTSSPVAPLPSGQQLVVPHPPGAQSIVPTSGPLGEIKHGLRRVILCKDSTGKVGVQLISVDKGIFVNFVTRGSPAALGGLRFGDQVVSINGTLCAGMSGESAMKLIRKGPVNGIEMLVRDRPFERTIMVNKSSTGSIGITLDDGEIKAIVKDSSAARNGVLIHHQIVEVNGQNVMGMKDKELKELLHRDREAVRLTILPSCIYKHLVKRLCDNKVRREMDRSLPSA